MLTCPDDGKGASRLYVIGSLLGRSGTCPTEPASNRLWIKLGFGCFYSDGS
jgi:hypothetical protein